MKYSEQFKGKKDLIQKKTASIGFDGFVDYLIHPVKTRKDEKLANAIPQLTICIL